MTLQSRIEGAVGWLTMDRPAAANSLNREMAAAMTAQLKAWRDDSAVRAVVLTGSGRAVRLAGADLKEVAEPPVTGEPDFLDVVVGFVDTAAQLSQAVVIAAVNGLALAGGLETVMACDLVLAAESAKLGDAHSNFGVFPGAGGAAVLPRKVPANVARWLLFTGASFTAAQMERHGLVNEVVADASCAPRAQSRGGTAGHEEPAGAGPHEARGGGSGRQVAGRRVAARVARTAQSPALPRAHARRPCKPSPRNGSLSSGVADLDPLLCTPDHIVAARFGSGPQAASPPAPAPRSCAW
ncbi:enoyl-CoA hydratase/isomerase family protein [Cupriavidus basilensis]